MLLFNRARTAGQPGPNGEERMPQQTSNTRTKAAKKATGTCGNCPRRPPGVEGLLLAVASRLQQEPKASVGDYIRLLELQKELGRTEAKEVRVTWVHSKKNPTSNAGR
jgi:hypothetical protein